jgi:hypothetical protein
MYACLLSGFYLDFSTPEYTKRSFSSDALFLDSNSLKEGWETEGNGPYEACSASPLGSGCLTYGEYKSYKSVDGTMHATETIYIFKNADHAERNFQELVEEEFIKWPDEPDWYEVNDLLSINTKADNEYLACITIGIVEDCQLASQYEEFVVVFRIRWIEHNEDLLYLFIANIDDQIVTLLEY